MCLHEACSNFFFFLIFISLENSLLNVDVLLGDLESSWSVLRVIKFFSQYEFILLFEPPPLV